MFAAAGKLVVLDLSDVQFLASDGLAVLVDTAGYARARSVVLRIVTGTSRQVLHPLELTGLNAVLPLYPTLPGALDHGRDSGADDTGATAATA